MVDQGTLVATAPTADSAAPVGHGTPTGVAGLRTWAALKGRSFRLYWGSSMAHMGAMNVQQMVQPWFMYEITQSSTMLGYTALASAIPMMLFSPVGGYFADRFAKKNLLFVGQLLCLLVALALGAGIAAGLVTAPIILGTAVLQGLLMSLMMPARQAMVVEIVEREHLSNALALNNAGMNVNRMMIPAAAGLLVAFAGAASGYFAIAALYAVALVMTAQLEKRPPTAGREGFISQMRAGLTYVRGDRTIAVLLLVTLGGVALSMPYMTLLPVFTKDVLHVGPDQLGYLMALSGGGALVTSLIIASMRDRNRGLWYLGYMALLGGGLVGLAVIHSYWLALLFIIPVGVGQAGRMAFSNILVQSYVEDAYRGRVMSIFLMEFGLTSLSTFGFSIVAEYAGIAWALGITGGLLVLFTAAIYWFVPRLTRLH